MLLAINRLKKDQDFQSVFKQGRSFYSANLRLKIKPNQLPTSRFGVVVGKVISKRAVKRNLLRRRLTEILRLKIKAGLVKAGFDVVVNVKPEALAFDYRQLESELKSLLAKAGLLIK